MTDLKHYGVLGMKWGVRRPVGSDGRVKKSGKARSSRRRSAKTMTDQELRESINRTRLENEYNKLNPTATQRGARAVGKWAVNRTMNVVNQQVDKRAGALADHFLDSAFPKTKSKKNK